MGLSLTACCAPCLTHRGASVSAPVSPGLLDGCTRRCLPAPVFHQSVVSLVLAGRRSALGFAALALALGWFAEEMGSSQGWFFGRYHYTTVLGPELGNVPVAIALMWFALCWLRLRHGQPDPVAPARVLCSRVAAARAHRMAGRDDHHRI